MNIETNFMRSLALTIIFTFVAPLILVGAVLVCVYCSGYIPGLYSISHAISMKILQFLATFGSGNSLEGIVIIALTFSCVGALFDTYAFYRYQMLRGN